jgi:predicted aldo/keto reductase-like oxidoreductase
MGVFIISPTDKGGMLQCPPEILCSLSAPLRSLQFNDLFCLQHPAVHTISVGGANAADFQDHLDVLPLLEDPRPVEEIYQRWQAQMRRQCGCGRPDDHWDLFPCWHDTPGYINIPFILWLRNLARGWDLLEFARGRYRMLGREMPWVAGNDGAQVRCYDFGAVAEAAGMEETRLTALLEDAHELLGPDQPRYLAGDG